MNNSLKMWGKDGYSAIGVNNLDDDAAYELWESVKANGWKAFVYKHSISDASRGPTDYSLTDFEEWKQACEDRR